MRDMNEDDALIRRAAAALQAPVRVREGFDERVMAAVHAAAAERSAPDPEAPSPAPRRGWLLRPRTLRLSPLAGLAIAAGVVGVAVLVGRGADDAFGPGAQAPVAVGAPGARVTPIPAALVSTRFALVAPAARTVTLVGDFNDWDAAATPLRRGADGVWEGAVPLPVGRHEYGFVVDGAPVVADPAAPRAADNDFGAPNSVVTVGGGAP